MMLAEKEEKKCISIQDKSIVVVAPGTQSIPKSLAGTLGTS